MRIHQVRILLALLLTGAASAFAGFDHTLFTAVLETYVNAEGDVDYPALKKSRAGLDAYIQSVEAVRPSDFNGWNEAEQIASMINAYNAKTLQVVIDHYPIKPHWKANMLKHPLGIRHIDKAWDRFLIRAGGRSLSLNEIEHEVLRKNYREPRVHMALVCASISCPNLRREAYTGDRLAQQLDEQTRQFLASSSKGFRLDAAKGIVWVSALFNWFSRDFVGWAEPAPQLKTYGKTHRGILNFILPYLPEEEGNLLASRTFKVDYLDYDWGLNGKSSQKNR